MSNFKEQLDEARKRAEAERLEKLRKASEPRKLSYYEQEAVNQKEILNELIYCKTLYRSKVINPVVSEIFDVLKSRVTQGQEWVTRPVRDYLEYSYSFEFEAPDNVLEHHTNHHKEIFDGTLITRGAIRPSSFRSNEVFQLFVGYIDDYRNTGNSNQAKDVTIKSTHSILRGGKGSKSSCLVELGLDKGSKISVASGNRYNIQSTIDEFSNPEKLLKAQDSLRAYLASTVVGYEQRGIL